ncbi:hypothetical protein Hanom_Chr04g00344931 [Helianthus anomalus]
MENIRAIEERLAKEKVYFETYKRTEEWVVVSVHIQNEACVRENEKFYRLRQEIVNLKAANARLKKREVATVAAMEEAIVARTTTVKAMEKANLARNRIEENARKDLQAHELVLAEVNRRLVKAEARATKVKKSISGCLISMPRRLPSLICKGIANAILDALEANDAVAAIRAKKFTDEQYLVRKVDAEGELKVASDAYDALVVPTLAQVEEFLAADTYVDRLRGSVEPKENVEGGTEGEGQG